MVGFDIRNMGKNDLRGIISLNNMNSLEFDYLFDENKYKVIVAQLNDDIIGYIKFQVNDSCNDILIIKEIFVDIKYRGLGVGHQLMIEVEEFAKNNSISSLLIINKNYLEEEIIFYNKQGFNLNNKTYEKKYYIQ